MHPRSCKIGAAVVLLGLLVRGVGADRIPENSPAKHPESFHNLAEIQGIVEGVDAQAQQLSIRDTLGRSVNVLVPAEAPILNEQNRTLQLSQLQLRDKVRIYLDTETQNARQVDVIPSVGDVLLGR